MEARKNPTGTWRRGDAPTCENFPSHDVELIARAAAWKRRASPGDIDDLVQTTLLCCWKNWMSYSPDKGTLSTWVTSVLHRRKFDADKKRNRQKPRAAEYRRLALDQQADGITEPCDESPVALRMEEIRQEHATFQRNRLRAVGKGRPVKLCPEVRSAIRSMGNRLHLGGLSLHHYLRGNRDVLDVLGLTEPPSSIMLYRILADVKSEN